MAQLIGARPSGALLMQRDFDTSQAQQLTLLKQLVAANGPGSPGTLDQLIPLLIVKAKGSAAEKIDLDNLKLGEKKAYLGRVSTDLLSLQGRLPFVKPVCAGNIFELVADGVNGSRHYEDFFGEIGRLTPSISTENWDRFAGTKTWFNPKKHRNEPVRGLEEQFDKLASEYKNTNSIGGYKGPASEIISAFRAAAQMPLAAIRVPMKYKDIDPGKATTPDKSNTALPGAKTLLQDIDRTERVGADKFYVEVKADAKTADKSHGWNFAKAPQLKRYEEVAETKEAVKPKGGMTRHIAIQVTDPSDWVELFLGGTLGMYAARRYWLFVGDQRFSPDELDAIWSHVRPERAAIDKSHFPPPAVFAGGLLPDLTPYLVPHRIVDATDWFEFLTGSDGNQAANNGEFVKVGGFWITQTKLKVIVQEVAKHADKLEKTKFPAPDAFLPRTLPNLTLSYK